MECDVPGGGGVGMCNVSLRCLGILRQSVLGPVFSQLCAWVWSMCVWGGQKSRVCRVFCIVVSMCFGIRVLRPCSVFLVPGHTSRGILTANTTAVLSLSRTHIPPPPIVLHIYLGAAIAFHFKYGRRNVYIRYLYLVLPIYLIYILCTYLVGIWVCSVGTRRYLVHKVLVACSYASVLPIIGNEYIKSSVSHFVFVLCIRLSDTHSMKIP